MVFYVGSTFRWYFTILVIFGCYEINFPYFYLQYPAPKIFVISDPSFGFRNGDESPLRTHGDPDGGASAGAGATAAPA